MNQTASTSKVTAISAFYVILPICLLFLSMEVRAITIHEPLMPLAGKKVTITSRFANLTSASRIELRVISGIMTNCTELGVPPSVTPCRKDAVSVTYYCLVNPTTADPACSHDFQFGEGTLVTYSARVLDASGTLLQSDEEVTFLQASLAPTALLRPVLWHSAREHNAAIDIGFFPADDYGDDSSFWHDVESIVGQAFFGTAPFASTYSENHTLFNVWSGPFGAEIQRCIRTFDPITNLMTTALAGSIILHGKPLEGLATDCSTISLKGHASVFTGSNDSSLRLLHESGHFLHGLGDEYPCKGGYHTADSCRNLFLDAADCTQYKNTSALAGECKQLICSSVASGFWHIEGTEKEIMDEPSTASAWRLASHQCVLARLENCRKGLCFP